MLRLPTENTLDREEKIMAEQFTTLASLTVDGKGSYGIGASAVPFSKDLYTYLRITDIKDDGTLNLQDLKSVDDEKASEYLLKPNDIVFARTGASTGRNYFYDGMDGEFVYAGFLIKFSIDEKKVNPKYIKYFCQSKQYKDWINSFNTGSTRGNINAQTLGKMPIPLIERTAQDALVSILSSIDEKIKKNNEINNNLEQQAVLLFKKWFIEFDNSSKNMLETRFGLVPESFKLLKNGELPLVVTDYVANGSFASLKANVTLYQEPNYAYFIRNTDLKSGTFEVFVDEHSYNFLSKSTLYGGEIIISNVGDVGSVFLCPKLDKPMTLGNNIIMLRPEQENLRYYLYIWFKWLYGQSLIQGIKGGSAQPKFNKTDFKNLPIFLPPDDLLEQFHQIVKPMFELINENNTENQALTRTRDTILPRLMSGELDVSDIEI